MFNAISLLEAKRLVFEVYFNLGSAFLIITLQCMRKNVWKCSKSLKQQCIGMGY